MQFTLTENAAKKILEIAVETKVSPQLRLGVAEGGCHGFAHALWFSEKSEDDDFVFQYYGITVRIAPGELSSMLDGTIVDYVRTPEGFRFTFYNPNIVKACVGCTGCDA